MISGWVYSAICLCSSKDGRGDAPEAIQAYWENGKREAELPLQPWKPDVKRRRSLIVAQRVLMDAVGSDMIMWSTGSSGFRSICGSRCGPNLGGSQSKNRFRPAAEKLLQSRMTFAFDGFHSELPFDGILKTISVEELWQWWLADVCSLFDRASGSLILVGKKK